MPLLQTIQRYIADPPPEYLFEITEGSLACVAPRSPGDQRRELLPQPGLSCFAECAEPAEAGTLPASACACVSHEWHKAAEDGAGHSRLCSAYSDSRFRRVSSDGGGADEAASLPVAQERAVSH